MIEVLGNLMISGLNKENSTQTEKFLEEIEIRFKDSNSFVRTKALQVCTQLIE